MNYLIFVSILWSFSFGIIKYGLEGVDSFFISFSRNLIAFSFFAGISLYNFKKFFFDYKLLCIGAIQFGLMYIFYIQSYQFLPAYLVATFTITTPIFIAISNKVLLKKDIPLAGIYAILLVLIGSFIMRYNVVNPFDYWKGFFLIQIANFFFAAGQILFKDWNEKNNNIDIIHNFSQLFLGASIVTSIFYISSTNSYDSLSNLNLITLFFLGFISSGLGFLLWNIGATKVSTEKLAISNNIIIPIAVINSYLIFGEQINLFSFLPGLLFFYIAYRIL